MRVPTSVWLFLALTVLTCIIAYWADNLGKNLGKKRISLFGLRPRQSATLISMASSVAIMLLTLLLLTFLSTDFKNAVFRADRLNDNNQKLRAENDTLEKRQTDSRAEVERLTGAAQQSKKDAQQAGADEAKAQRETAIARGITQTARAQLASTRKQLAGARNAVGAAQSALNVAKNSLGAAKTSLGSAQRKASEAAARERAAQARSREADVATRAAEKTAREAQRNARLSTRQKDAAQKLAQQARGISQRARGAAKTAKDAAGRARDELRQATNDVQAAKDDLENAKTDLEIAQTSLGIVQLKNAEFLRANREAIQQQLQLQKQNSDLETDNSRLIKDNREIVEKANAFVTGDIGIAVGQVFAERIVAPGKSAAELQFLLDDLQNEAAQVLEKPPINATSVNLATLTATVDGQRGNVAPAELRRILIENLLEIDAPVAVRWVAARNYRNGEREIEGRLVTIEVKTVVPAGTMLAQDDIAAGQSDGAVFNQLLALTDEARSTVRAFGVIPPLSPKQPYFFAAGTNERVFAALREIQSRGGARVSLIADAPLSTVVPPPVRFVFEANENAAASTRAPDAGATAAPSS